VRAYWNGTKLVSKHSSEISCPDWFIDGLPSEPLDGELWMGRGKLEVLNGTLWSSKDDSSWKQIFFMIFDLPSSKKPYEIRMRDLANLSLPNHVQIIEIQHCKGNNHLMECAKEILDCGGEGLMLNKPNSMYTATRTDVMLKVKVQFMLLLLTISNIMTLTSSFWKFSQPAFIVYSKQLLYYY
jgi:DNA ligase-1